MAKNQKIKNWTVAFFNAQIHAVFKFDNILIKTEGGDPKKLIFSFSRY